MTIDGLISVVVTITLIEMMVGIGLAVAIAELAAVAKNWRLAVCACVANYVAVPAIAVLLLLVFQTQPMVSAGILILAVCPGAPYGPPFAAIAKANVTVSAALMVILAGSSAIVAPILLKALMPLVAGREPIRVDTVKLISTLLVTQLIPLGIGLGLRHRWPTVAARLLGPANLTAKLLNVLTLGLILIAQSQTLMAIRPIAFVKMHALLFASLAVGWVLGGRGAETRKSMALSTALRNVGVGLVIATASFGGSPAVTAALAYGIVEVAGSLLIALWWGRRVAAAPASSVPPVVILFMVGLAVLLVPNHRDQRHSAVFPDANSAFRAVAPLPVHRLTLGGCS